jgi:hypothetical protein
MTVFLRTGRFILLWVAFGIAMCGVAGAAPGDSWKGTLDATDPPGGNGHTVGKFTLMETLKGNVQGSGSGEWSAPEDVRQLTITVAGQRDVDALDLTIDAAWGGRFTTRALVQGKVAEGTLYRPEDPATPRGQIRLQCQNCAEPVG